MIRVPREHTGGFKSIGGLCLTIDNLRILVLLGSHNCVYDFASGDSRVLGRETTSSVCLEGGHSAPEPVEVVEQHKYKPRVQNHLENFIDVQSHEPGVQEVNVLDAPVSRKEQSAHKPD